MPPMTELMGPSRTSNLSPCERCSGESSSRLMMGFIATSLLGIVLAEQGLDRQDVTGGDLARDPERRHHAVAIEVAVRGGLEVVAGLLRPVRLVRVHVVLRHIEREPETREA